MTLSELMVVITVATMVMAFGAVATVPRLARETMRSALHDGGTLLRAARIESVKRNRACSFVIDLNARTMSVVDTNGTATSTDDVIIRQSRLPSVVSVSRPDAGSPITFALVSGNVYQVEFNSDGHVSTGAGEMVLCAGEWYDKVLVYSAGGVRYERWNGTSWSQGS
jgi:Tfp pilus assembly protein FimT